MAKTRSQTKADNEDTPKTAAPKRAAPGKASKTPDAKEKGAERRAKGKARADRAAGKVQTNDERIAARRVRFAEPPVTDEAGPADAEMSRTEARRVRFADPPVTDEAGPADAMELDAAAAAAAPDTLDALASRVTRAFGEEDWIVLNQNEHGRFIGNPAKVGTAVFRTIDSDDGPSVMIAQQYPAPIQTDADRRIVLDEKVSAPPLHRPLVNFSTFQSYGKQRIRAESPGGTDFFATEMLKMEVDDEPMRMGLFRPLKGDKEVSKGMPFWGGGKPVPFFKPKLKKADKEACLDGTAGCQILDGSISKHQVGEIDYDVVIAREGVKGRSKSQNKVMGISACNAVHEFSDAHEDVMSDEMRKILHRSYKAPLGWSIASNWRPEHCHLYAHSLKSGDPQTADNLAAAPKWANTKMMILERWAKWLAFNCPDSQATLDCEMALLHGKWEVAEKIEFSVESIDNGHTLRIDLDMDPWAKYPSFSPSCHIAQTAMTANSIHRGVHPREDVVPTSDAVTTFNELYTEVYQKDRDSAAGKAAAPAADAKAAAMFAASMPSRAETMAQMPVAMKRHARAMERYDKDAMTLGGSPGMFSQFEHVKKLADAGRKMPSLAELRQGQEMMQRMKALEGKRTMQFGGFPKP